MKNNSLKSKNLNAGSVVLATVLIAVIVFLAAALGYSLYKNSQWGFYYQEGVIVQNKTNANQSEKGNETANWKTYRNDEYGYLIKYPLNWYVGICNRESIALNNAADICISSLPPEDGMAFVGEALQILVAKANYNSLSQEIKNNFTGTEFTQEAVMIDGIEALKIKTKCEAVGCGAPLWVFMKDNYFYEISTGLSSDKFINIFSQIVSTFKFTK